MYCRKINKTIFIKHVKTKSQCQYLPYVKQLFLGTKFLLAALQENKRMISKKQKVCGIPARGPNDLYIYLHLVPIIPNR